MKGSVGRREIAPYLRPGIFPFLVMKYALTIPAIGTTQSCFISIHVNVTIKSTDDAAYGQLTIAGRRSGAKLQNVKGGGGSRRAEAEVFPGMNPFH
jgi:hypothetical protein